MVPRLLLFLAVFTLALAAGCPSDKVKTGPLGKGGLPTNNVDAMQGTGTAGTFLAVPEELMYPGATEIEGRPGYYKTNISQKELVQWATDHIPGAVEVKESKNWVTLKGLEWTVKIYDNAGTGVIQYTNNKYLPKSK
ncbi:MAG TPA: hypothetical protein VEI97_08865 [bacterium]|nr:hypothetical protein [bacterium]